MTHEFKHPKYYTELRKRNKSDQVISLRAHDGERERAPGQGLKLELRQKSSSVNQQDLQASSSKPQASSSKPQASSTKSIKPQATSSKPQA
jgi:hypothetical protein